MLMVGTYLAISARASRSVSTTAAAGTAATRTGAGA